MQDNEFTKIVDEVVNFFMSNAAKMKPEDIFEMTMAVYMNLLAIIPYPVLKIAQAGGVFPEEYRQIVMGAMPEFTVSLRGYSAEFIQGVILKAIEKGIVREGPFEFLGKSYNDIPEPPTSSNN